MNDNNKNSSQSKKLKWACRRGMLELDVLLSNFLEEIYPGLDEMQQKYFVTFLNYSDPELFAFLLGQKKPDFVPHVKIAQAISQHAKARIPIKTLA